jgi:endonuclease YncB( thermonuclease family)
MSARPVISLAIMALAGCAQLVDAVKPIERGLSPPHNASSVANGPAIVIDARTIEVAGRQFQLYGIDAPDADQVCQTAAKKDYPCGIEARDYLVKLVGKMAVNCAPRGPNEFDMTLAVCAVGRTDLALAMVEGGWAIADRPRTLYYEESELATRVKKIGLWQGPFVTPQEWRNGERVPATRSLQEQQQITP